MIGMAGMIGSGKAGEAGAAPVVLPALAPYSGAPSRQGITMVPANAFAISTGGAVSGLVIPANALNWSPAGDWWMTVTIRTSEMFISSGASAFEAFMAVGTAPTSATAVAGRMGRLNNAGARTLEIVRNSASNPSRSWWTAAQPAPVIADLTTYTFVIGQRGNLPFIALAVAGQDAQVWDGADNRSGVDNFYKTAGGVDRAAATFFDKIGGFITGSPSQANGAGGSYADLAMVHATISNAQIRELAEGAIDLATVAGCRYYNPLTFDGTNFPAVVDVLSAGPITRTARNSAVLPSLPSAPLRTANPLKLDPEPFWNTYALMPGQTAGAVWFDGSCAITGYPIYARLRRLNGTDLVAWTQIIASHLGGAFSAALLDVPANEQFTRDLWIGPPTSTIGGSDGHLLIGGDVHEVGIVLLGMGQSQFNYQVNPSGTGVGVGSVMAPAAVDKFKLRIGVTKSAYLSGIFTRNDGPAGTLGTLLVPSAGLVGDGFTALANAAYAALPCAVEMTAAPRSGHSLDAFAFDRTTWTMAATGSGTAWSATLRPQPVAPATFTMSGLTGCQGVEPGSLVVTWPGGSLTDAANASLTGTSINSANPQTVSDGGNSMTINYQTGALTITLAATSASAPQVAFTTRFDTTEGNQNVESPPDKYTLFGNTDANGVVRRHFARKLRRGVTAVIWYQATSNIADFASSTEPQYEAARNSYAAKLDALRDRIWALCPNNPPFIVMPHNRGTSGSGTSKAYVRRAQHWMGVSDKVFTPGAGSQLVSGATPTAYRWPGGFVGDMTLEGNAGEHQDAQAARGGTIVGAVMGEALAGLMLGNINRSRGPEFQTARLKSGDPKIIEVVPTFFGSATALAVGPGGNTAALTDWIIKIGGTPESSTVRLRADGLMVEILRVSGADWPASGVTVEWKTEGMFITGAGGEGTRAADEAAMNSNLYDNKGGFLGLRPGAEGVPIFPPLVVA